MHSIWVCNQQTKFSFNTLSRHQTVIVIDIFAPAMRLQLKFPELIFCSFLCILNQLFHTKTTSYVCLAIFFLAPLCLCRDFCKLREHNLLYELSLKTQRWNLRAKKVKLIISRVHSLQGVAVKNRQHLVAYTDSHWLSDMHSSFSPIHCVHVAIFCKLSVL